MHSFLSGFFHSTQRNVLKMHLHCCMWQPFFFSLCVFEQIMSPHWTSMSSLKQEVAGKWGSLKSLSFLTFSNFMTLRFNFFDFLKFFSWQKIGCKRILLLCLFLCCRVAQKLTNTWRVSPMRREVSWRPGLKQKAKGLFKCLWLWAKGVGVGCIKR